MRLVFSAMAEQRHRLIFGEMLQEAESEFLAMILDSLIAAIDRPAFPQFLAVSVAEFGPFDFSRQKFVPELLTWAEIGHPNIETVFRQAPASTPCRENPQTILASLDFSVNRLCFEHGFRLAQLEGRTSNTLQT